MEFMKSIKLSIIISLVLVLLSSCSNKPKFIKGVVLSDLTNPHEIISDDKHLIISDGIEGTTIYIYSLENFSLFSKFGGTGESRDKFIVSQGHEVNMDIRNDKLLISSHWKTSFFNKSGDFEKEFSIKNDTYGYLFLEDKYIGEDDTTLNDIMYYTFNLYDKQFKFVKEITRIAGSNQGANGLQVLVRKSQGIIYENKYFIKGKSEEFEIESYDSNGNIIDTISQNYNRIPVEEKHMNSVYKMYKDHPLFGQFFDAIKKRIIFPEYLPAIYNINIANNFIYALTYETDGVYSLLYKLDLNGKLIDKLNVPLKWNGDTETYPFTISNNKLYQLVMTKSEKWELQIIQL